MSVVVGSAITRPERLAQGFAAALEGKNGPEQAVSTKDPTVLAIGMEGGRTLAALVRGGTVLEEIEVSVQREASPQAWLDAVAESTHSWRGRYEAAGLALAGSVEDGQSSGPVTSGATTPEGDSLGRRAQMALGVPVLIQSEAQAAAWGEFQFGAGEGEDLVFLAIAEDIGGGIVLNGTLVAGKAGRFGLLRGLTSDRMRPLEQEASGRWMTSEASRAGRPGDVADVIASAQEGADWARAIVSQSARKVALLCQDIQFALDPARIVIGGEVGLAEGYREQVMALLPPVAEGQHPLLVAARCGRYGSVLGVASLVADAP